MQNKIKIEERVDYLMMEQFNIASKLAFYGKFRLINSQENIAVLYMCWTKLMKNISNFTWRSNRCIGVNDVQFIKCNSIIQHCDSTFNGIFWFIVKDFHFHITLSHHLKFSKVTPIYHNHTQVLLMYKTFYYLNVVAKTAHNRIST